ncbi:MAG: LarC family nickel insertion protein [Bacillota bacterium]
MDILYFDCLAGISGDMTIGALLDLGVEQDKLRDELNKIELDGYQLEINRAQKSGITGTDFKVKIESAAKQQASSSSQQQTHNHDHADDHSHQHSHEHSHNHNQEHSDEAHHSHDEHSHENESDQTKLHNHSAHGHRNLHNIKQLINSSNLEDAVKELSIDIFELVAQAEAKVHNKDISEVHFHEVGAIDSIIDIVGTAVCIKQLDVDEIYASKLHVGTGFVDCAHGTIPVPAPATTEILKGVPIYSRGIENELVTPTGAAIIKTLADEFIALPEMEIEKTGYGLGDRELEITNMLRVLKGKKKVKNL